MDYPSIFNGLSLVDKAILATRYSSHPKAGEAHETIRANPTEAVARTILGLLNFSDEEAARATERFLADRRDINQLVTAYTVAEITRGLVTRTDPAPISFESLNALGNRFNTLIVERRYQAAMWLAAEELNSPHPSRRGIANYFLAKLSIAMDQGEILPSTEPHKLQKKHLEYAIRDGEPQIRAAAHIDFARGLGSWPQVFSSSDKPANEQAYLHLKSARRLGGNWQKAKANLELAVLHIAGEFRSEPIPQKQFCQKIQKYLNAALGAEDQTVRLHANARFGDFWMSHGAIALPGSLRADWVARAIPYYNEAKKEGPEDWKEFIEERIRKLEMPQG